MRKGEEGGGRKRKEKEGEGGNTRKEERGGRSRKSEEKEGPNPETEPCIQGQTLFPCFFSTVPQISGLWKNDSKRHAPNPFNEDMGRKFRIFEEG